jgi:hypothetical protein
MAELQQAIDRYLQSLVEQAMKNPGDQRQQPQDRNARRLDRNDLQKLLDQARQLARTGARDAAKDLLARLQEMLENLRTMQANREGQQQQGQPGDGQAQEMMKSLQEMMQRQQSLIDRTFRRSQQNRPGQFRFERDMTVVQALAVGGGVTLRGTEKGLTVSVAGVPVLLTSVPVRSIFGAKPVVDAFLFSSGV